MPRKKPLGPMGKPLTGSARDREREAIKLAAWQEFAADTTFADVPLGPLDSGSDLTSELSFWDVYEEIANFSKSVVDKHVRKSNREYYLALAKVYQLQVNMDRMLPSEKWNLLDNLEGHLSATYSGKYKRTVKQKPIHMLLRLFIHYSQDEADKRNSDKAVSRDARAILYAASKNIPPIAFAEQFEGGGAGLDRWALAYSALLTGKTPSVKSAPKRPTTIRMLDETESEEWSDGAYLAYIVVAEDKAKLIARLPVPDDQTPHAHVAREWLTRRLECSELSAGSKTSGTEPSEATIRTSKGPLRLKKTIRRLKPGT
jgi:hypothetical protein